MKGLIQLKKLFALLLAVVMCAAMVLPAYADAPASTGSIVISNPENAKTYHAIKVFDAEVSHYTESGTEKTNVSYFLNKADHEDLFNLIDQDASYNDGSTTILNPFKLQQISGDLYEVFHKDGQETEFGRGWLYGLFEAGEWTATEAASAALDDDAHGSLTVGTDLDYGYYMVYKTDTDGSNHADIASVINVVAATNTIADKNPTTPGDPDKKVRVADGTYAATDDVELGQLVHYQASFMATNYRTYAETMTTKRIISYTVRDDSTGLKYAALNSCKVYRIKTENGFDGYVEDIPIVDAEGNPLFVPNGSYGGYTMDIPWAKLDNEGNFVEFNYPSPCYVVLEYEAYVTEAALNALNNNTATNTFTPMFKMEGSDTDIPLDNPPSVKVYTTGLSIVKKNNVGTVLEGAKFKLSKVENGVEKFYTIKTQESLITHETWKDIEWVDSKDDALEVEAKSILDEQTFGGLTAGTYKLYETVAPDGYVLPSAPWIIEITFIEGSETLAPSFSAKIGTGDNATNDLALVQGRMYFNVPIENVGGRALPQTGAAGTTMLLLVGGAMFAVTMLFLVTKKRLYNEG